MGYEENVIELPNSKSVNALYLTGMDGKKTYLPEFPSMDLAMICEQMMTNGYANLRNYGPSYSKQGLEQDYPMDKAREQALEDCFIR